MTEYEADSIIDFWGGVDSCKNLVSSWSSLPSGDWKDVVEKNYHISLIVKALEFKNEQV